MKLIDVIAVFALLGLGCSSEGSLVVNLSALSELQPRFVEVSVLRVVDSNDEGSLCEQFGSAAVDVGDPRVELVKSISFHLDEEVPEIGLLTPGRYLFVATVRGDDGRCPIVGAGCVVGALEDRQDASVEIVVETLDVPLDCPQQMGCIDGECGPCHESAECDDHDTCTEDSCVEGICNHDVITPCQRCDSDQSCDDDDPCTVDRCDQGTCAHSPDEFPDGDEDGHANQLCGGDDCDDGDNLVYFGAERRCGRAIDHDCDGTIDDLQGCGSCEPTAEATINHVVDMNIDARQGLFVLGTDEPAIDERLVLAVSPTDITVASFDDRGTYDDLGSIAHGANEPLAPVVSGDSVVLIERIGTYNMMVFSRAALEAGESTEPVVVSEPEWGRPYSAFVSDGTLYVTANTQTLWAVDLDGDNEGELTPQNILSGESSWRNCIDVVRTGDRLVCIDALMDLSSLAIVDYIGPGEVTPHRQFVVKTGSEPMDLAYFPEVGDNPRIGLTQRGDGLVLFNTAHFDLAESAWSPEFQAGFPRVLFPGDFCATEESCQWATNAVAFGSHAAMVLTRNDHLVDTGVLRLYYADLSDASSPIARASVEVSQPLPVPGREDHLFVSGSFVFVATSPESSPLVRVYSVDCDGP